MNSDSRRLLAAMVAQRMDMGEREWWFDPRPMIADAPRAVKAAAGVPAAESRRNEPPAGLYMPEGGTLEGLESAVSGCTRCPLASSRMKFVFGSGNPSAEVMFVGEAPGADEDMQGLPFVGRAGQLLTRMIEAIKLRREDVYIANILKCRPPGNRDPHPAEIEKCEPILIRQIELIRPKIICALGRISGKTLLRTEASLAALRGKVHDYHGVKLVVTYHPAALLRNPNWKRPAWDDLKFLRREYDGMEIQ